MFDSFDTNDLIRIAHAGAGFTISSSRGVEDLIRIAHAASANKARLRITGAGALGVDNLIRIGHAGGGAVEFG